MVNKDARAVCEIMLGDVAVGKFIRTSDGRIFYVDQWGAGKYSGPFPVMEDKTISRKMDDDVHPMFSVEIINMEDLGISEIKKSDP